ncbi:MAG: hypothetical protein HQM13_00755 [SAR324 cluster bacterium]|nr:hypothetical protein [SAR324 cluster bacterium]
MKILNSRHLLLLFAAVLLGYSSFRAVSLSFTHDESLSYLAHAASDLIEVLSFKKVDANHHYLNTILMYAAWQVFSPDELVLRLPNLIAHCFYLFFTYGISRKTIHFPFVVCSFLILNLNPFVLDFFSLARGYGLGLSLMMGSLYYLFEANESPQKEKTYQIASVVLALLSVLSNLIFLNFYCALIVFLLLTGTLDSFYESNGLRSFWLRFIDRCLYLMINILIAAFILTPILKKLLAKGAFYHGGETGFWHDTVGSLIRVSIYGQDYPFNAVFFLQLFIAAVVLGGLLVSAIFFYQKKWPEQNWILFVVLALTGLSVMSTIAQHCLFQTKFLVDRTGIFFIPMFALIASFTFSGVISISQRFRNFSYTVLIFFTLMTILHFFNASNFTHVLLWKNDADTKAMMSVLVDDYQKSGGENAPIKFYATEYYQPAIDFYRQTLQLDWLKSGLHLAKLSEREAPVHFDYAYGASNTKKRFMENDNFFVKQNFAVSQNLLLRKKNTAQVIALYENAHLMMQKGELSQAVNQYQGILKNAPEHAPSHHDLALIYEKLGNVQKAELHWKLAIERDYTYASAYLHLASLALSQKNPETAFTLLKNVSRFSESPAVYNGLGDLYYYSANALSSPNAARKDFLEALKFYRKSAEAGNGEGQQKLARMYELGYGVENDDE